MILTNLDSICRRWLLERNYPIHYYFEALMHSSTALRELSYDTLQIINCANLPTDSTGAVNLPDDFVDDLSVCLPLGGTLTNLPKQDWITPLRIHSTTTGEFVPYANVNDADVEQLDFWGFPGSWSYYWNVNDYGEPTGRFYGSPGGTQQGYKLIKSRRQIQMTAGFEDSNIVLLYISDGQSSDNATQIDVLAQRTIHCFIDWQRSPNATNKDSREARTFQNEQRKLRARLNDLTRTDLLNILRNAYKASLKS